MTKSDIIHFKMSTNQLGELLVKIKDLVKIDSRLILKINNENILLFSFVGESFKDIHAFKNYVFDTKTIIDLKEKIEESLVFIVKDGKKFNSILENFIDFESDVNGKLSFDEDNFINYLSFDNKKLNIKILGGTSMSIGNEINVDDINHLMNIDNSIFNFKIDKLDFEKIKRMSKIEKQPKDIIYLHVKDKNVLIGETKWHLNICDIESDNVTISFPKDYFISMNPSNEILSYVFESFILFKYDEYNLMVVLEIT